MEVIKIQDSQPHLKTAESESKGILEVIKDFQVEEEEDFSFLSETLRDVKKSWKDLETEKKTVTDPLNATLKKVRSWFKPAQDYLKKAELLCKKKLSDYQLEQVKKREKAMIEMATAKDFDGKMKAAEGLVSVPEAKGITIRETWKYEVKDISKVPVQFLAIDDSAVKQYIKEFGKGKPKDVPGLEFVQDASVIARS